MQNQEQPKLFDDIESSLPISITQTFNDFSHEPINDLTIEKKLAQNNQEAIEEGAESQTDAFENKEVDVSEKLNLRQTTCDTQVETAIEEQSLIPRKKLQNEINSLKYSYLISLDLCQAAKINSKLSKLRMRIDPEDLVLRQENITKKMIETRDKQVLDKKKNSGILKKPSSKFPINDLKQSEVDICQQTTKMQQAPQTVLKINQDLAHVVEIKQGQKPVQQEDRRVFLSKPSPQPPKPSFQEAMRRIGELLSSIKNHPASFLFNNALDSREPQFHKIKHDFSTLSMIELQFKIGQKYEDSNHLAQDIRKMIMIKMNIAMEKSDVLMYSQIQGFHQFFEDLFKSMQLENISLQKFQSQEERLRQAQKKMETLKDRNNKVSKALLEKRSQPLCSHINLNEDEKQTLKVNIDILSLEQKKGILPIIKEYQNIKNNNSHLFTFDLDDLNAECLAKLNEYVYSNITANNRRYKRKEQEKRRRDLKAAQKQNEIPYQICNQSQEIQLIDNPANQTLLTELQLAQLTQYQLQNPQFLANQAALLMSKPLFQIQQEKNDQNNFDI